jgi:transcription elongation factor Elf1
MTVRKVEGTGKGACPHCGSQDINYGRMVDTGDDVYYPLVCAACGKHAHEVYGLEFVGMYTE